MALNQTLNQEQICDLTGKPVHADASVVLKALDKLLTLGAYYSTTHEQYIQAAEEAATAITQAIRPRQVIPLEITSEGLMILDQLVHPSHRNVRQVHDLLVPLNIARLEIDAQLTAQDLRQALEGLQQHKLMLGKVNSFKEIIIENLPSTVRSVSRSVLQQGGSVSEISRGMSAVQEMMEEWAQGSGGADQESMALAREFMEMVMHILDNLENSENRNQELADLTGNTPVSRIDFDALRQALKRLVEVKPSPQQLLQLMTHARSALDLSRDSGQVDLVFQILRKDILGDNSLTLKSDAQPRQINYKLSVEQLVEALRDLDPGGMTVAGPDQGAASDHLAICLYLLAADPPEALRQSLLDSLQGLFQKRGITAEDLDPCLGAIVAALNSGYANRVDDLVAVVFSSLRQARPELVGQLWFRLKERVQPEDLPILWPHLVNDILMGLGQVEAEVGRSVLLWAGQISVEGALHQQEKLETMSALQANSAANDIFKAPLSAMYPVHAVLARTRLVVWLGRGIHSSMKARPFNPLIRSIMASLNDFEPTNLEFYLDLISQAKAKKLSLELRQRTASLLLGMLGDLPRVRRDEKWVPGALTSLGRLGVEESGPLFDQVLNAKRLFFFNAWPQPCRDAVNPSAWQGEE